MLSYWELTIFFFLQRWLITASYDIKLKWGRKLICLEKIFNLKIRILSPEEITLSRKIRFFSNEAASVWTLFLYHTYDAVFNSLWRKFFQVPIRQSIFYFISEKPKSRWFFWEKVLISSFVHTLFSHHVIA